MVGENEKPARPGGNGGAGKPAPDKSSFSKAIEGLQAVQLVVTVVLAILAYFLNAKAQESKISLDKVQSALNSQEAQFKQSISSIETDVKVRQENRLNQESLDKLHFQLFEYASSVLDKKENTGERRLAASALVTALLDTEDPLRIGLIQALRAGADANTEVKLGGQVAKEQASRELDDLAEAEALKAASATSVQSKGILGKYVVDVFTCEKDGEVLKGEADKIVKYLGDHTSLARARNLYRTVDASPGFRISGLQLRYTPDEQAAADALKAQLTKGQQGNFSLRIVKKNTPNYLSVFVCK